ncbi:MAG: OmpA family protein [Flavobacteriales bacterium]|nr:OmpA family protein [Flavobacteriales bacterium]MBK7239126.1 OmpA family protein [Flavobacteriales bacterium]MBP9138248.1 OmpA family protein [Flavobacteriales bacterium]HQV52774.1 OmpA family protein [Flavobacteriales bacterium]HQX29758.1 OmpA family protein [Flavobacteriales bacterium]
MRINLDRILLINALLFSFSGMAQQDLFRSRIGIMGGVDRYIGDIQQSYSDVDIEKSSMIGVNYQRSLSYGTALYGQYSFLRFSANDIDHGNRQRALNFLTEAHTFELGLQFRMDNGKLLRYDARFAPFFSLGVGAGLYNVYGDLYSASGSRYNYWSDGTIRDLGENSAFASSAVVIDQDGVYDTELTYRRTENGKPSEPYYIYVPAKLGVKWRISDRLSAEVFYGFNWTFTDYLDDIHDAYPIDLTNSVDRYASNPTGNKDPRGNVNDNDHYHYAGLSLSWNFGRRSHDYRVTPIYIDHGMTTPVRVDTVAVIPPPPPPPAAVEAPKVINIVVEQITVGKFVVDTLVVTTLIQKSITPTSADTLLTNSIIADSTKVDTLSRVNPILPNDTVVGLDTTTVNKMLDTWVKTDDSLAVIPDAKIMLSDSIRSMNDSIRSLPEQRLELDSIAPKALRSDTIIALPKDSSIVKPPVRINGINDGSGVILEQDSLVPAVAPTDSLKSSKADQMVAPLSDTLAVPEPKVIVPIPQPAVIKADSTRSVPEPVVPKSVEQEPAQPEGSVTPKNNSQSTTAPPPTVVRNEPAHSTNTGTRTTERVVTVPVIVRDDAQNQALKDSLSALEERNARLQHLADSLANGKPVDITVPVKTSVPDSGLLNDTRYRQHTQALNGVLVERINTLERYIDFQKEQGNDSIVEVLRLRILDLDSNVDGLRDSLRVAKDRIRTKGATLDNTSGSNVNNGATDTSAGAGTALSDTVYFSSNSYTINTEKRERITMVGKTISGSTYGHVLVTGHSDQAGDASYNLRLSQFRADEVARQLVEAGVPQDKIVTKGLGEELSRKLHSLSERNVIIQVVLSQK